TTRHDAEAFIHRADEVTREYRYEYRRDTEGNVVAEIARDRAGQVVWTLNFSEGRTTGYYTDNRGLPRARGGTGAAYVAFVYTDDGLPEKMQYLDKEGEAQPNAEGVFAERCEYDERGLRIAATCLDSAGVPTLHKDGYATAITRRDEMGNPIETA